MKLLLFQGVSKYIQYKSIIQYKCRTVIEDVKCLLILEIIYVTYFTPKELENIYFKYC